MSNTEPEKTSPRLHEIPPRETAGRDTLARYQAQFRAAANECLGLLEDNNLDRVYCDYQDDFVTRLNVDGRHIYNFYQVKTKEKRNHQWSINEIFGLYKKRRSASPDSIANSFAGKLLIHTVKFKNSCGQVIFLTNVHFDDDVEACSAAISSEDLNNLHYNLLVENFNGAFSLNPELEQPDIQKLIAKLALEPGISHLAPEDGSFSAIARDTIFQYSEIDLQHGECEEIINNLISLVERKSFSKLVSDLDEKDLDEIAGIGLPDMLDILSISKGAYKLLKQGGDSKAIKSASIIHRIMKRAGSSDEMIEYTSQCKVNWDYWLREKRHTIAEFELNFLLEKIDRLAIEWIKVIDNPFGHLQENIETLFNTIKEKGTSNTIDKELLLGAVFSSMVRNESQ